MSSRRSTKQLHITVVQDTGRWVVARGGHMIWLLRDFLSSYIHISSSRMIFSLCLADNMWSWLDLGYLISKKGMWGGGVRFS